MLTIPLGPRVRNYFLTFRCNSTCEFCSVWRERGYRDIEEAPLDVIKGNLKDIRDLGVFYVDFTGGEPLLREDLGHILAYAKSLNFFTSVTTDGTLYKERAQDLRGLVNNLIFSLDAPEAQEHDRIRGTKCFDEVINSIQLAKKLGENPIINFTITRESIRFLPEMVELAEKLNTLLWINPVYDHFGLQGFSKDSLAYIKRYFKHRLVGMDLGALTLIQRGGNQRYFPRCKAVESVITILPDNSLARPCFFYQDQKVKINGKLKSFFYPSEMKKAKSQEGRGEICEGCLRWGYMIPSLYYKLDRCLFQSGYSQLRFLWKKHKHRRS